ncbi:MAG TPA: cytochrome c1 [Rhodanobacteraceae bacterium]
MRATRTIARWSNLARWLVALALSGASATALAAHPMNTKPPLKHIHVSIRDTAAVRTGAMYYMHQCLACHSLQVMRFSDLAKPLGLTQAQVQQFLKVSTKRPLQTIVSPMPPKLIKSYLGIAPPDLSVESQLRSADWLYTYLTSFYVDPKRPTGVNNVVVHNVAMPDVFAGLQGLQSPVMKPGYRFGSPTPIAMGVKPLTQGSMTPAQFDTMATDIVAFLEYTGHPHRELRHRIGLWVMIAIAVWIILAYIMYKLYWRDVALPHGPRWWSYWKRKR